VRKAEKVVTWCSQEHNLTAQTLLALKSLFESNCNRNSADGYEIVATAMAHAGEGVHLGVDANNTTTGALLIFGSPGGVQAKIVSRNDKALLRHVARQQVMGVSMIP